MEKFKNKYRTESTRLQYWDYSSPGYYFITICTKNRINYFGEIENGRMNRNKIGDFAQKFWLEIPNHFFNVTLNEFIIMPNHIHGIVVINNNKTLVETRHCLVSTNVNNNNNNNNNNNTTNHNITNTAIRIYTAATNGTDIGKNRFQNQGKKTISSIIGSYKSICTKTINKNQNHFHFAWQPRFYEHIIRNEESLDRIKHYIVNNPENWYSDRNNL